MARDRRSEYARLKARAQAEGLSVRAYKEKRKKQRIEEDLKKFKKTSLGKNYKVSRRRTKGHTPDDVKAAYVDAFVRRSRKNQQHLHRLYNYYVTVTGSLTDAEFRKRYPSYIP
jgi:hypothetical protein